MITYLSWQIRLIGRMRNTHIHNSIGSPFIFLFNKCINGHQIISAYPFLKWWGCPALSQSIQLRGLTNSVHVYTKLFSPPTVFLTHVPLWSHHPCATFTRLVVICWKSFDSLYNLKVPSASSICFSSPSTYFCHFGPSCLYPFISLSHHLSLLLVLVFFPLPPLPCF